MSRPLRRSRSDGSSPAYRGARASLRPRRDPHEGSYVLVSILSVGFPGTLVYIVLWLVIPQEPA